MEEAVRNILNRIDKGLVFDSHFVIAQIIKQHSDAYIHFAGPREIETTAQMHGRIAQLIGKSGLAEKLEPHSWSDTIHGKPDRCDLWQRI